MLEMSRTLVVTVFSAGRLIVLFFLPCARPLTHPLPLAGERRKAGTQRRSALLGAVARRDLLLRRVLAGDVLDQRRQDRVVGSVPVGDDLPLLAVPLVD